MVSKRHEITVSRRVLVSKRHEITVSRRLLVSKRREITVSRHEMVRKRREITVSSARPGGSAKWSVPPLNGKQPDKHSIFFRLAKSFASALLEFPPIYPRADFWLITSNLPGAGYSESGHAGFRAGNAHTPNRAAARHPVSDRLANGRLNQNAPSN